ncbi:hypothetical protein ACK9YZ_20370 [Rhizobium sp. ZK1]|uniref:hypothetical protein n=1 Tax=Rhizobium sp. ZK1 TaxID=3389872 RepID=UPI0039F703AA
MKKPSSVTALTEFGRTRLSKSFFMRDFLFSDVAAIHGIANVPDNPDIAIAAGSKLCELLLEPLQDRFGRLAIRSAFRSIEVNGFCNEMQRAGKSGYTCASNDRNFAGHIWDQPDRNGGIGATACIVVPAFWDHFQAPGDWRKLAWWIHDHLPYSYLEFFPTYWAFNIQWHEKPIRQIYSFAEPRGWLTKSGMENHEGSHDEEWTGIVEACKL